MGLSEEILKKKLSGIAVRVFDCIDSTNKIAKAEDIFTLVTADRQTLGRGRLGKSFFSPPGGIYMSVVLPTAAIATIRTAVAVCRSIERFSEDKIQIKWVNDLFSHQRKIAGILCELSGDKIIVGIGININRGDFPDDIKDLAGSVRVACEREALIADITSELVLVWKADEASILDEYKSRLFILGESIEYTINGIKLSGIATDINNEGNLIVSQNDVIHTLNSGEITLGSNFFTKNSL